MKFSVNEALNMRLIENGFKVESSLKPFLFSL